MKPMKLHAKFSLIEGWVLGGNEFLLVFISLILQVSLAFFLGHYYDMRVFMATGYSVSSGLNPYEHHNLVDIFHNSLFQDVPGIGYPPLLALLLGLIYRLSFNLIPNILLYNFAIKIPVIIGNIALAYLVKHLLVKLNVEKNKAKGAWLFILFNPFILYTTSAWGQYDAVIVLLVLASLYFLHNNKIKGSAILFALSLSIKPIALPLIALPIIYTAKKSRGQAFQYLLIFALVLLFTSILPFYFFNWSLQPILSNLDAHFIVGGGMSYLSFLELVQGSYLIPESLQFIGFIWIPALIVGYYLLHLTPHYSMEKLFQEAVIITFIFFLTRTWLSEPNINLILPFMLILAEKNKISWRNLNFTWSIPIIFTFLNFSLPQLFFMIYPPILTIIGNLDNQIRSIRLIARSLIVVSWQVLGWSIVKKELTKHNSALP